MRPRSRFPALTKLLEDAISQAEEPLGAACKAPLAKLYVRRAELASASAAAAAGRGVQLPDAGLTNWSPDDFAVARPLAAAFRAHGQEARAKTVLAPFLEPCCPLPTEQAAARLVLDPK